MQLELCVTSLEAARIAASLPVDRIETCMVLEQGGLTPTRGMVAWIHQTFHDLEQHVLVRCRPGGFRYSYDEIVVMRNDILEFRDIGVKGIVIGALTTDRMPDREALAAWLRAAGDMDLTFHRAFDEVADWKKTMDQLIDMGFKRILTSGQAGSVGEGMTTLQEMSHYAADRIEVMAGGGVRPENVAELKAAGVSAIHFSGTKTQTIDAESRFAAAVSLIDRSLVQAILENADSCTR